MSKEAFKLKNRPRFNKKSPLFKHFAKDIDEWFEGFEKDFPFKLDVLAEQIYNAFKKGCANVTIARELVQRWADKEIIG